MKYKNKPTKEQDRESGERKYLHNVTGIGKSVIYHQQNRFKEENAGALEELREENKRLWKNKQRKWAINNARKKAFTKKKTTAKEETREFYNKHATEIKEIDNKLKNI